MSNVFNRLAVASMLFSALISGSGLLSADQRHESAKPQVEKLEAGTAATQLAMNDTDLSASQEREKEAGETGPVLLVPMVLALLALVAVSRRKES